MSKIPNAKFPAPTEKVCYNCRHMMWLVGIGQGVRCGYEFSINPSGSLDFKTKVPIIPHLGHTCEHFEFRKKEKE